MAVKFYLEKRLNKQGEAPIRCSVTFDGKRLLTTTGHSISPEYWNAEGQKVLLSVGGRQVVNSKGVGAKVINAYLKRIDSRFSDYNLLPYNARNVLDLKDVYDESFGKSKSGRSDKDKIKGFFDYFEEFTQEMGAQNDWTKATYAKFATLKHHIKEFSSDIKFSDLDEKGLANFVSFMRDKLDMRNSTIGKQLGFLKWFLRWADKKGYCTERAFLVFAPKLKATDKKVVFLEWEELMKVYSFKFPTRGTTLRLRDMTGKEYERRTNLSKKTLEQVRDVFCFCCFTSLRYSDVANLKRSNIFPDYIQVTTIKTADTLKIELNKYSRSILEKYTDCDFPLNKALPVISNQRMNEYLKEMGEICGLNSPITITYYKGHHRIDEVFPKWQMLGTHTGRRTFICNALMFGIAPQVVMKWTGHSDYKSMRPYIDVADTVKADSMKLFDKEVKRT